jgi:ferredoxin
MKKITIKNSGKELEASPAVSILNNLLKNGVKIPHVCGGKALCGTCRIRITEADKISRMGTEEELRLKAVKAPEGFRLACQTYAAGDITIELP